MPTAAATRATPAFDDDHAELLLELLRLPTVTPMETRQPSAIERAQVLLADRAAELGFEIELHEPASSAALRAPGVPLQVLEAAERMGPGDFLACQPNMVLRLGPPRELERTLMLNAHLDTVGGHVPVGLRDGVFSGRGAVDMKGPAVALLAALGAALAQRPDLTDGTTVLLQLVAGEESGAMGSYGTRVLVERGLTGRLNVFAEPSGGVYFDSCTASMTARIRVDGNGSTDDEPEAGENATLLLGYVAAELAARLDAPVAAAGAKVCIGGLATGTMHDRVYGEGTLMVNLAYPTPAAGRALGGALDQAVSDACASFADRFGDVAVARRTAHGADRLCRVEWLKRGLPPLAGRDAELERRLVQAGLQRLPDSRARERFTCDAIWGADAPGYTIVFGPGTLVEGGAHTPAEHVRRDALESYARAAAALVLAFDDRAREVGS